MLKIDDSKFLLNFGMSVLSSNLNQIKSHVEEREPTARIEVLFSGAETGSMRTMVFSFNQVVNHAEFNYMTIE